MKILDFLKRWYRSHPDAARLAPEPPGTAFCHACGHDWDPLPGGPLHCPRCKAGNLESNALWWTGVVTCGICGHSWVGVVEIAREQDEPIVPLECPGCGHFRGVPF